MSALCPQSDVTATADAVIDCHWVSIDKRLLSGLIGPCTAKLVSASRVKKTGWKCMLVIGE